MEMLPERSQTTQMTGMTLIAWIDLSSIPDDRDNCVNFEVIIWKHSQTTGTILGFHMTSPKFKLLLLLSFYFHVVLQHLKTFIPTNFSFERVLHFATLDT